MSVMPLLPRRQVTSRPTLALDKTKGSASSCPVNWPLRTPNTFREDAHATNQSDAQAAARLANKGALITKQTRKPSRRERDRRTVRQQGTCLFCGKRGSQTKQHVFGEWLRDLDLKGRSRWEVEQGADTERHILPAGSLFSKKLRIVCKTCNTGWMSRLETAAKPHIMAMFSGRHNIPLEEPAQLVLARWAFQTIAVLAQLRLTSFPLDHCHELYDSERPPEHSQIWIGTASINASEGWDQVAEFAYDLKPLDVTVGDLRIPVPVYSTRFRLMNVVFEAYGFPVTPPPGLGLRAHPSAHLRRALLPIWPSEHPTIWWPPVASLDTIGGVRGLAAIRLLGPAGGPSGIPNAPG